LIEAKASLSSSQAIVWHPKEPLLCTGGGCNGLLVFWHAKKRARVAIVRDSSPGVVEHVLWNKLSGELVVHWTHERPKENSISIFANFSRIVDTVSVAKEEQVSLLMFNHAHDKLSTQVLPFLFFF